MKSAFLLTWTLVAGAMVVSCARPPGLEISISNRPPPNPPNLVVINRSESAIKYVSDSFDHDLDVWHLSGVTELRGREIGAFVVFAVDEDGDRHLRCGSKDGPTPSADLYTRSLGPGEQFSIKLPEQASFRSCLGENEKKLYWQVVYIKVRIDRNIELSEPRDFKEMYQSNLVAFPDGADLGEVSTKER